VLVRADGHQRDLGQVSCPPIGGLDNVRTTAESIGDDQDLFGSVTCR